jgi:hypothetical protein
MHRVACWWSHRSVFAPCSCMRVDELSSFDPARPRADPRSADPDIRSENEEIGKRYREHAARAAAFFLRNSPLGGVKDRLQLIPMTDERCVSSSSVSVDIGIPKVISHGISDALASPLVIACDRHSTRVRVACTVRVLRSVAAERRPRTRGRDPPARIPYRDRSARRANRAGAAPAAQDHKERRKQLAGACSRSHHSRRWTSQPLMGREIAWRTARTQPAARVVCRVV